MLGRAPLSGLPEEPMGTSGVGSEHMFGHHDPHAPPVLHDDTIFDAFMDHSGHLHGDADSKHDNHPPAPW